MIFGEYYQHIIRSWRHHLLLQLGALTVLSGTFTIIFSIFLFFSNLEKILISWGSNIEVNVYLRENLAIQETEMVATALQKLNHFKDVKYVAKDEAANKFFSKMSKYIPEFTDEKEFMNIIPASFIGTLKDKTGFADLKIITKNIESVEGVEDLSYGQEWIENFSIFINSLKNIGWAISLTLIFGALFVIGFTAYSVVVQKREEIEIYELFGASRKMIQMPFVFEGAVLTFLASLFAMVFSYFILSLQNEFFVSEMIYLGMNSLFQFFGFFQILAMILISTALGAAVSYYCVRKLNTGWSSSKQEFWS